MTEHGHEHAMTTGIYKDEDGGGACTKTHANTFLYIQIFIAATKEYTLPLSIIKNKNKRVAYTHAQKKKTSRE